MQYVAREIMNHSHLLHPHIVQFKEVCECCVMPVLHPRYTGNQSWSPFHCTGAW